MISDKE